LVVGFDFIHPTINQHQLQLFCRVLLEDETLKLNSNLQTRSFVSFCFADLLPIEVKSDQGNKRQV